MRYTTGNEDGSARDVVIETGTKAVLEAQLALLKTITEKTSMIVPTVLKIDRSGDLIPEPYIILDHQPASVFNSTPNTSNQSETLGLSKTITLRDALDSFDDREKALLELRLGSQLRELHAIDNLWFGSPGNEGDWGECISCLSPPELQSSHPGSGQSEDGAHERWACSPTGPSRSRPHY